MIESTRTADLIWKLNKQYFNGVTTSSRCQCGSPSRGGDWCVGCLTSELIRRGCDGEKLAKLQMAYSRRQDVNAEIDALVREMIDDDKDHA